MDLGQETKKMYREMKEKHPGFISRVESLWDAGRDFYTSTVYDPRLKDAIKTDALGAASGLLYLLGPEIGLPAEFILDIGFSAYQAKKVEQLYGDQLGPIELKAIQLLGAVEEIAPFGVIDLIPTVSLAHLYVHAKDAIKKFREEYKEEAPIGVRAYVPHPTLYPA